MFFLIGVTSDSYCNPGSDWTQMFEWIDSLQRWDSLMLSSVSGFNLHPGEGLKGHRDFGFQKIGGNFVFRGIL